MYIFKVRTREAPSQEVDPALLPAFAPPQELYEAIQAMLRLWLVGDTQWKIYVDQEGTDRSFAIRSDMRVVLWWNGTWWMLAQLYSTSTYQSAWEVIESTLRNIGIYAGQDRIGEND